eukprot:5113740-Pleurochrysis_carterae.AAC.1
MGSLSSWPSGVCARLRREANAGGVTRASSIRVRMYVESRGPSAMRPPSAVIVAAARVPAGRSTPRAAPANRSARAAFNCGG